MAEIDTVCFRICSNFEYDEYAKLLRSKYNNEVSDLARYVEDMDSRILALHSSKYAFSEGLPREKKPND